jgi:ATP-dependent DNA helicase RecG
MPSSIDKLLKFLKLERERGYDNRAVVGGLDKIVPSWINEARANGLDENQVATVILLLQKYPQIESDQRPEFLEDLVKQVEGISPAASVVEAVVQPVRSVASQPAPAEVRRRIEPVLEPAPVPLPAFAPEPPQPVRPSFEPREQPVEDQRPLTGLTAPLTVLQGIGPKTAQTLSKLELNTLGDLLYFFPRRYDDYSRLKPINRLEHGEEVTVIGTIQAIQSRPVRGGATQLVEAVINDGTGSLRLSWFGQPWLINTYQKNDHVVVAGKLEQYLGRLVMNSPEIESVEQEHLHTNRIVPIYPLTAGMTQKTMRRMMYQAVSFWAPRLGDFLPASVRSSLKLLDLSTAILQCHFPESQDMLDLGRWRLAFDEIFLLQLGVMRQKRSWQQATARVLETSEDWLVSQTARFPYTLTGAQQKALADIRADLTSGHPMDRLLQGDVGSGKTAVAALAVAMVARHGAQSAVMAPTSILADQHYRNLTRLLSAENEAGPAPLLPEQIRLLIGDTSAADKQDIRDGLADGSIKLVIGTHALIEDPVQFQDLQLVVVDEQHRFGVAQRAALRAKGSSPHLLVMTATPIPRSLALTVYGDLDLTVMDEMPVGRLPISTHVVPPLQRERAYQLIRSQVEKGRQAFVIYPLVEQGDKDEALAAVEEHARLQSTIFPLLKLGLLHGRLRPDEKDEVMSRFRDGEFNLLVSTSVVEVGVDVPNATVMVIEGANRFGLAQLHQFRGRVGRGGEQSYCLLIPDRDEAVENERLAVMEETNNGFVLAECDLQQRGPGEFLGTRQAGFSALQMANLTDIKLIEKARNQAQLLFQADPDLSAPQNASLSARLDLFWGVGKGDVS